MQEWAIRVGMAALASAIIVTGVAPQPARALPASSWPVTPATLGSLYGSADRSGLASVRIWGPATWCEVQPTEDSDVSANLDRLLAPRLDEVAAAAGAAIITIGHPAPWVFDDHPRAVASAGRYWFCGDHASAISIPSPKSMSRRTGAPASRQETRWANYVEAYVDWITQRYGTSLKVVLEVWNEPNLKSGIDYRLGIPGAAGTREESVAALHRMESIAHGIVRSRRADARITLASSAMLTRPTQAFTRLYLAAHNRQRRIDAIHVNIYAISGSTPGAWAADWDERAAQFRSAVRSHRSLRTLPLRVVEANLNLTNLGQNNYNLRASTARPDVQRRMAAATQMNAYFRGYTSVHWLVPWDRRQAAVHIQTTPGNPARDALTVLNSALQGHQFAGCTQVASVRTCRFNAKTGPGVRVVWRTSGSSELRLDTAAIVLEMTGDTRAVSRGTRLRIGATPIVLR
jgi:hypothetical protein